MCVHVNESTCVCNVGWYLDALSPFVCIYACVCHLYMCICVPVCMCVDVESAFVSIYACGYNVYMCRLGCSLGIVVFTIMFGSCLGAYEHVLLLACLQMCVYVCTWVSMCVHVYICTYVAVSIWDCVTMTHV